ncbi:MAG: hypothetical protein ABJC05_11785, partial [Pyrinomonadaceae bacterium]
MRALRLVGRRPRVVLAGALVTSVLVTSERVAPALAVLAGTSFGSDDSTGAASGVGAAAASAEGGSAILAPTDETRLPFVPGLPP